MVKDKSRKSKVGIELEVIDGKRPKSSTGIVDPKLFSGEANLHILRNPRNMLWTIKYDSGFLPEAIRDQWFTSFEKARACVEKYFNGRNLKISKVIE